MFTNKNLIFLYFFFINCLLNTSTAFWYNFFKRIPPTLYAQGTKHTAHCTLSDKPHYPKWRLLVIKILTQSHVNFRMNHPQKPKYKNKCQQKTHTKRVDPTMLTLKLSIKSLNLHNNKYSHRLSDCRLERCGVVSQYVTHLDAIITNSFDHLHIYICTHIV